MGEIEDLRAEVERLTEGSAWKRRIAEFLFEAEADDRIKEVVDEQIRFRMQDFQRTEDRYMEVSEALRQANLVVRDGKVFYERDGELVAFDDIVDRSARL